MKVRRYQGNEERTILTALILHDGVLGRIHHHLLDQDRPFKGKWSNLVARWCFDHFTRYGRAPKASIQNLFEKYAQASRDTETVEIVDTFLSGLSDDYRRAAKTMNEDYLVDLASNYFSKVQLARLADSIQAGLDKNDSEEANSAVTSHQTMNFSSNSWTKAFELTTAKEVFMKQKKDERIVQFSHALDTFLSPYLKRGGFVSFAGPDKRGKSYWLLEVVWQALKQGRHVLYYALGDMSREEVLQRLYIRMTRRPWKKGEVFIPRRLDRKGGDCLVKGRTEIRPGVRLKDIAREKRKLELITGAKEIRLNIKCEGGNIISAGQIEEDVKTFTRQGWVPDVVVVDYADLLLAEPHTRQQDVRHQMNGTWMVMRRIALNNHCLVVTATQTAATAYDARIIRKRDFSEDKRKNAHVTGMIGINQTDSEKERGLYRLNWIVLRGGKWSESKVVWTAGELSIACPCILSSF